MASPERWLRPKEASPWPGWPVRTSSRRGRFNSRYFYISSLTFLPQPSKLATMIPRNNPSKVLVARFLAGLLIIGQPAMGLPAYAADTLRPSIQGVQDGLEEVLWEEGAGLEEQRIGLRLGPGHAVDFVPESVQQRIVPGRGLVFQAEPPLLLPGIYHRDAGMEADLQQLRKMVLNGYQTVSGASGRFDVEPIVRWAQDRIHSGFQPGTRGVTTPVQFEDFLDDLLWDLFLPAGEIARPFRQDGVVDNPRFKLLEPLKEEPYLTGPASTRIWVAQAQRVEGPADLAGSAYSDVAVYDREISGQRKLRFHDSVLESTQGIEEIKELSRRIRQEDEPGYLRLMQVQTEDEERRHAQDYAWAFRFFGRTLRKHPARKILVAEALVKPGSLLDRSYWTPTKLSRDVGKMQNTGYAIAELAGQAGSRLKRMEILLREGKNDWAYALFWMFLLEKIVEFSRTQKAGPLSQAETHQKFVAQTVLSYTGRSGHNDLQALADYFSRASAAPGAASRGRRAYEFLLAFYDENFLTDPEREQLFSEKSVGGLEEVKLLSDNGRLTVQEESYVVSHRGTRSDGSRVLFSGDTDMERILGLKFETESPALKFAPLLPRELFANRDVLVVPGYGNSPFLLKNLGAHTVVGVDKDPVTVAWQKARILYGNDTAVQMGDLSRLVHYVEEAREGKTFPGMRVNGMQFMQGNLLGKLPLPDEAVDTAIVPYVFSVPNGLEKEWQFLLALNELLRVTRSGGTVLILPVVSHVTPLWDEPAGRFSRWIAQQNGNVRLEMSEPFWSVSLQEKPALVGYILVHKNEQKIAGLEEQALTEQWQGMRSAAQGSAAVVIGPSVAGQFGGLEELARLDGGRQIFVDRGADTALQMLEAGVAEARYYGGLEEAGAFQRIVAGAVLVSRHAPTEEPFRVQVEAVLRLAGVPEPMIQAGLEEFAAELDSVAVGA